MSTAPTEDDPRHNVLHVSPVRFHRVAAVLIALCLLLGVGMGLSAGPVVSMFAESRGEAWGAKNVARAQKLGSILIVVGLLGGVLTPLMTRPWFARRCVGLATPGELGFVRVWVCGILAIHAGWEHLASAASLPPELRQTMGFMRVLDVADAVVPFGYAAFRGSHAALAAFDTLTVLLLLCAAFGLLTRVTLPLATACYFVFAGIIREYSWFTHQGLVPWYCLVVLCLTRCGDGFSLDRRRRERLGRAVADSDVPTAAYGWGRYAVWAMIAATYVVAGLSKLRNGGTVWASAENMKAIILADSLKPMHFDFGFGLWLTGWPDVAFAFMGWGAILAELAVALVLVSRTARMILPAIIVQLHLGIWLFQNVLFFDLLLLPAVFYDRAAVRAIGNLVRTRFPRLPRPRFANPSPRTVAPSIERSPGSTTGYPLAVVTLLSLFGGWWMTGAEVYPLSGFQMYSHARSGSVIVFPRVLAHDESGGVSRLRPSDAYPILSDARYRRVIDLMDDSATRPTAERVFLGAANHMNARRAPGRRITAVEVQRVRWDFVADRDDADRGVIVVRHVMPLQGERTVSRPLEGERLPSGAG